MSLKTSYTTLSLAAVLLSLPLLTFGAVETVSSAYMGSSNESGPFTFTDIPVFNSSLGSLLSIQFNLDLEATPYLSVFNSDSSPENYTGSVSASGKVTLEIPTSTGENNLQTLSGLNKLGPISGTLMPNGTAGDSMTIDGTAMGTPPSMTSKTSSRTITNFTPMYIGTSGETYNLNAFFTEPASDISGNANAGVLFGGGDDLYSCLSVEYFYAAVPEPATLPLVALSIGALFIGRRLLAKRASVS